MLKKEVLSEIFETVITVIIMVIIIRGFFAFVAAPFVVDGQSMYATLHDKDRMWMMRNREIDRFDVVVFPAPNKDALYIKRVIGVPGDTIEYRDDHLILNGETLTEPYLKPYEDQFEPFTYDFTLEEVSGEKVVPEGKYFVLGDNRRNSVDGRAFGFIDMDAIEGEADVIWWPLSRLHNLDKYQLNEAGNEIISID